MTKLSPEQIEEAERLRRFKRSWSDIAKIFGTTTDALRRALDPEWAERRCKQVREARQRREGRTKGGHAKLVGPVSYHQTRIEAERLKRQIPRDTRDLTQRLCGDPIPGRSALDKLRQRGA